MLVIRTALFMFIAFMLGLISSNAIAADDFAQLYQQLNPSVVTIRTIELVGGDGGLRPQHALGSGVIVSADGLIITASHVVHTADRIVVELADGQTIMAQVVSSSPASDLALIQLDARPQNPVVAKLGDSDQVEIGQQALVIGAPLGVQHSLSVGFISGRQASPAISNGEQLELIQTDAAINHGNSGGPLFNSQGEVVGIVSRILSQSGGSDGIGFAVPINLARAILLEAPSFWAGFDGLMLSDELAKVLNVPNGSGVIVQRVTKDSLADRVGMLAGQYKINFLGRDIWVGGDIILSIQGTTCDSPHNFRSIKQQLESLESGQEITMVALRAGETIKLSVRKAD